MDEKSGVDSFFVQLRKVGLATERGVAELTEEFEKNTKRCPAKAILKLSDLKKDVKETKLDVRAKLEHSHQIGEAFDEFLGLCVSLITKQQKAVLDIETFMQQYGYTPRVTEKDQEEEKAMKTDDAENTRKEDTVHTPPSNRGQIPDISKTPKTPVMEHEKLLSYRSANNNTSTSMYNVHSVTRSNQVPKMFQHNGLLMTPSLIGDESGSPYSMWTPAPSDMPSHKKIPRLDLDSHMPVDLASPEIQTPSMKRLAQMSSAHNQDVRNLSKAVSEQMMACSPVLNLKTLPLKTTSVKKVGPQPNSGIGVKNLVQSDPMDLRVRTPPISRIFPSEMPKTPELTCDLSKLREMANNNNLNYQPSAFSSISKGENPRMKSGILQQSNLSHLQTELEMPQTPELTYKIQTFHSLSHTTGPKIESIAEKLGQNFPSLTPTTPDMLTTRLDHIRTEHSSHKRNTKPAFDSLSERLGQNLSCATPPTPDMLTTRFDQLKAEHSSRKPNMKHSTSESVFDSPQLLGTYNFRTKYTSKENLPPHH
ncbi:uncharacterized protein [Argopecten irradians]|uniref:uncharacterized protein n=1 Tax=Argopecten irradians TaxID=31199 RepID=UPI00371BD0DA